MSDSRLDQHIRSAVGLLQAGRSGEARRQLELGHAQGLQNTATHYALAVACRAVGDFPAANKAADRSLELEPRNPRALFLKAELMIAAGKKRAASAFYRDAIALLPPGNLPPDFAEAVKVGRQTVAELSEEFEGHLTKEMTERIGTDLPESIKQSMDIMLGRRRVYYPQPRQYFFPGLPVAEFYAEEDFDWIPALEAATDDITAELTAILENGADFGAYVTGDEDRPNIDSHGMKGNKDWGAFYLWYNGEEVPENQAQCPKTVDALKKLPLVFSGQRSPNVLFSRLKAGAKIPPHTGMVNTRLICHLPLIVPEGCGFRVGNTTREWQPGKVWAFDDTVEHEAWNNSDEDRIILLFEVWKPELSVEEQKAVTALFAAVDAYE